MVGEDNETAVREFLDKMRSGDFIMEVGRRNGKEFRTQCLNRYFTHPQLMSGSLEKAASEWDNKMRFIRNACLYLYDQHGHAAGRVWILIAEKSVDLCGAIQSGWRRNDDVTLKMLEATLAENGWKPGVDFVVEDFDNESESVKFEKIGEQISQALKDCVED